MKPASSSADLHHGSSKPAPHLCSGSTFLLLPAVMSQPLEGLQAPPTRFSAPVELEVWCFSSHTCRARLQGERNQTETRSLFPNTHTRVQPAATALIHKYKHVLIHLKTNMVRSHRDTPLREPAPALTSGCCAGILKVPGGKCCPTILLPRLTSVPMPPAEGLIPKGSWLMHSAGPLTLEPCKCLLSDF